ncbi:glycosyltransferase [Candidatus Woesearchaeota archaeon]|nr:glycosyltransferase [Candidatus Woesearchaeota archaeon]
MLYALNEIVQLLLTYRYELLFPISIFEGPIITVVAGFLAAKGDLIANIDADTIVTKDWTRKVLKAFEEEENLVAISGPYFYYDLSWFVNLQVRICYGVIFLIYLFNKHIFNVGSVIQGGNCVTRRSAILKIDGFNDKFDFYGEDADLARRLHQVGDVRFTFLLPAASSGRRFKAEGFMKIGIKYAMNYFCTIFLKKPFSKKSIDHRIKKDGKSVEAQQNPKLY